MDLLSGGVWANQLISRDFNRRFVHIEQPIRAYREAPSERSIPSSRLRRVGDPPPLIQRQGPNQILP